MNLSSQYNHTGNNPARRWLQYRLGTGLLMLTLLTWMVCHPVASAEGERKPKSADKKAETNKPYPVNVSADELISQTKGGQSEYRGKVQLTRNKLEATGDTLLILHPNDKLQSAVLEGKPAKFKEFMPKKQEWVNGEAKRIIFDQEKDTVTLKDNAMIVTDKGNQIKAEQIILYNKTETFEALGDKKHGTRVQMVIQSEGN